MTDATLKAFVLEYAKVNNLDAVDIGMIAGSLVPDYIQSRPECLEFVMAMKLNAPSLFQTVKFIKEGAKNDNSK